MDRDGTDWARRFWDQNTRSRTYFDDLHGSDPSVLSRSARADREYVLAEDETVTHNIDSAARVIVDFGCGIGRHLLPNAARHPDKLFVGLDYSSVRVSYFARRLVASRLSNCWPLEANVACAPIASGTVDLVLVCYQTFGMFLGSVREDATREAARILRPNGKLYVGGFSNHDLVLDCYRNWGTRVRAFDRATGLVSLEHYQSLWQSPAQTERFLAAFGFGLVDARMVELGFLHVYVNGARG